MRVTYPYTGINLNLAPWEGNEVGMCSKVDCQTDHRFSYLHRTVIP